ncbi:MAG: hypothetical protein HQM08_01965 [Candidatus Riflebacteria bacterium]|nr:hypothetical protein [Candidatus Riflebacteria bacterium]
MENKNLALDKKLLSSNDENLVSADNSRFSVLYQDEWYVAIHKPAGWLVHPTKIAPVARKSILPVLSNQLGQPIFPVHRLDCATSGVLIFGMSSQATGKLSDLFEKREVEKTYLAVVRGWMNPADGKIERDLSPWPGEPPQQAVTNYRTLATSELPIPIHPHKTCRYSLLEVKPYTGRRQQIRRHFSGVSHPVIGDTSHGDQRHNRAFKEHFQCERLLLMAVELTFQHPFLKKDLILTCPPDSATDLLLKKIFSGNEYLAKGLEPFLRG